MSIDKASKSAYKIGRVLRWVKAIASSIKKGSIAPILRRVANGWIGRNIASKLWLKPKRKSNK